MPTIKCQNQKKTGQIIFNSPTNLLQRRQQLKATRSLMTGSPWQQSCRYFIFIASFTGRTCLKGIAIGLLLIPLALASMNSFVLNPSPFIFNVSESSHPKSFCHFRVFVSIKKSHMKHEPVSRLDVQNNYKVTSHQSRLLSTCHLYKDELGKLLQS